MKPAQTPRRPEPSIQLKPGRANRKQKQGIRRFLASITTTVSPAVQSVIAASGSQPSHPKPAIIVPIISPSSGQGNRGRKQQGISHRGGSSSIPDSPSSSIHRDRIIVPLKSNGGRKSGRREKTPKSDRPRGERTRHGERAGRNRGEKRAKHDRGDGGKIDRVESVRVSEPKSERGRVGQETGKADRPERVKIDRPERTKLNKTIRLKLPRLERPRLERPEKPKSSKKIQRLERKKQKLEKRLLKEKEKERRKKS